MLNLSPGQTLVFDGDSLTALRSNPTLDQWPWLRISQNHRSWADVFSELLFVWRPELNLKFRTAAVGGSTCLSLEARFESTIAILRPDWVLMTLGSNDANREIPLEKFEAVLRAYAERLEEWGGQLVFLAHFQPCPHASDRTLDKAVKRLPYYEVEDRLAAERPNVHCLDVGSGMREKAEILHGQCDLHNVYSDGSHFSHLGAMILAGELLKAFGVVSGG